MFKHVFDVNQYSPEEISVLTFETDYFVRHSALTF